VENVAVRLALNGVALEQAEYRARGRMIRIVSEGSETPGLNPSFRLSRND